MSKINKKRHQNDVNRHEHTVNWRCSGVFLFNFEHTLHDAHINGDENNSETLKKFQKNLAYHKL